MACGRYFGNFSQTTIAKMVVLVLVGIWCSKGTYGENKSMSIKLTFSSRSFYDGGKIPVQYSADGKNISPPFFWGSLPKGTQSLALICDDPDAPAGTWVHWVIYNIPVSWYELPEGISSKNATVNGAIQGMNSWHQLGWGGPSPPPGKVHHYVFMLYALDECLAIHTGITKEQLLAAMEKHILAQAKLVGTYSR